MTSETASSTKIVLINIVSPIPELTEKLIVTFNIKGQVAYENRQCKRFH